MHVHMTLVWKSNNESKQRNRTEFHFKTNEKMCDLD